MDPYLEDPAFWPDFHLTFIGCWREAIADLLPEPYEARLDERVNLVQMSPEVIKLIYPDVAVSHGPAPQQAPEHGAGTLLLEPVTIPHEFLEEEHEFLEEEHEFLEEEHEFLEEEHETRIEILHRPDRTLIAVLELLSPTNKTGDGFHEYRSKPRAVLQQNAHLIELDLLLGGNRPPLRRPLPAGDYFALLSRAGKRPNCEVFSWLMRDRLPTIPIPLKSPDADLLVDLEKVFQATFQRGRYGRSLSYGRSPLAPMSQDDAEWAIGLSNRKK